MNVIKRTAELFGYELINKKHQPSLMPHLRNLFMRNNVDLVIDAGANHGQFGIQLRRLGYRGEIHSFEPVSSTFNLLQQASAKDRDWHVHQLALGDENTQQSINISASTRLSSFLEPTEFGKGSFSDISSDQTETVEVRTLDTFFEGMSGDYSGRSIFLKMDTQGYDLNVFNGARDFHDNITCILTELSFRSIYSSAPTYLEALQVYEKANFTVTGFFPVTRNHDLSIIEMDCVMTRKDQLELYKSNKEAMSESIRA